MTKYKLEYIRLDGYAPTPNLRGKTQIKAFDSFPSLDELPLWGFDGSSTKNPAPQGPYYTGVGYPNVGSVARQIVEEHLDQCLAAGINHEGINAEVAKGQWEFQIFGKGSKKAADEMWMAR
jgi:glutamine synthetase